MQKTIDIAPFKGIPTAWDYVPYSDAYFESVKKRVVEEYGEHATTLNTTRAMNGLGNIVFFEKFPDLLNTDKEALGPLYQPRFPIINNNPITDFAHGLSHIRSRSSHTNMGEAMLVPDHYYTLGIKYKKLTTLNMGMPLSDCPKAPFEDSPYRNLKIPYHHLVLLDIRRVAMQAPYKRTYKEDLFKADFPKEETISTHFHTKPINTFEQRLSHNLVRAIYMDEKFKLFGSSQKSFIHTPVSTSSKEPYTIIFTDDEEDGWIKKIAQQVQATDPIKEFQMIVNTTGKHSSNAEKLAATTVKEFCKYYLPKVAKELA